MDRHPAHLITGAARPFGNSSDLEFSRMRRANRAGCQNDVLAMKVDTGAGGIKIFDSDRRSVIAQHTANSSLGDDCVQSMPAPYR